MNRLLGIGGVLVVLGGLLMLLVPGPPIPLLDANRQVLAESERDGYCAGTVFWNTGGFGDEALMGECLEMSAVNDETNLRTVQPAFCRAVVVEGYSGTAEECEGILGSNKLWPTMTGGLTSDWNRRFPYPLDSLTAGGQSTSNDESRTGDRDGNEREEPLR